MDEWRLDPLVARVVAWHNRHPLARRIAPHHVHALGFVALPHAVPAAATEGPAAAFEPTPVTLPDAPGSLRERAMARAGQPAAAATAPPAAAAAASSRDEISAASRGSAMKAAFSEAFIAPLSTARVVRWAARHARSAAAAPAGGPLRQVAVDDRRLAPGDGVVMLYAMTAAIEVGRSRTRVLLGPDGESPVLGRRLWSRPRLAGAGAGLAAALVLCVTVALSTGPGAAAPEPRLHAVPAPAPASAVPAIGPDPTAAARPPDVEPELGRIDLPPLVPLMPAIDDSTRAAARSARLDRPGAPPAAPRDAPPDAPALAAPTVAPAASSEPAIATAPTVWALSSRLLRTRAESRQVMAAVGELLRDQGNGSLRVEVLPAGDDWRVVGWPFPRRADAERARTLLVARGLRVEVVAF